MDKELYEINLTQKEARAVLARLMNDCVNEIDFQEAIKKIALCATQ